MTSPLLINNKINHVKSHKNVESTWNFVDYFKNETNSRRVWIVTDRGVTRVSFKHIIRLEGAKLVRTQ